MVSDFFFVVSVEANQVAGEAGERPLIFGVGVLCFDDDRIGAVFHQGGIFALLGL